MDVFELKIKGERKIVVFREDGSERMIEKTVGMRLVPGDFQIVIRVVPAKEGGIAEAAPVRGLRVGREILGPRSGLRSVAK